MYLKKGHAKSSICYFDNFVVIVIIVVVVDEKKRMNKLPIDIMQVRN